MSCLSRLRHARLASLLGFVLAACTPVGPDYPGAPVVAPEASRRAQFVRAAATPLLASEPVGAWWRGFDDPTLNSLIDQTIAANADIAGARTRLSAARAIVDQAMANRGPAGTVDGAATRARPSFTDFGIALPGVAFKNFDLYQANFDASWELDLFGRQQRAVEVAVDQGQAAAAALDDLRLSVTAEAARAYLALRADQVRLEILVRAAGLDGRLVALTETRADEGTASVLDLERLRAQQAATQSEIPGVRAAIVIQIDRLSILSGQEPGALDDILVAGRGLPLPPAVVAVGDPTGLIRRRPDIRAAERRLAATTAAIGIATADLFPTVTLTGSLGLAANDVVRGGTTPYSFGPTISWAVLDLDRVRARIGQAGAERDEALAGYQGAVLTALGDAEAGLSRYTRQLETVAARRRAAQAARHAAVLAEQRYREGVANSLETLDADRQQLAAEEQLLAAEGELSMAFVALQKSLGLAWAGHPDESRW